ncbi:MAG TPA: ABC transporter ATP-binding protein [Gemmatimonadaceae bacterium]|nr:ABC transporter ATP-binding protein [Gemmatimonadaceae bacterium]
MPKRSDSSEAPVIFDGVWKKFRRGERADSLRDLIPAVTRRVVRGKPPADELEDGSGDFWALRDVSFEVHPGEALGIIGPNGAGKSTILKLLTRILKPTRGTSSVRGRTGALIEVAAGFHADLTGRENIYLQGAILGMKRREIARTMDEIIEFADLGDFIDTPVKRFSSGMSARLGFSIAAHLDPDVLIIDEVLSVGDMAFQQRCLDRMKLFKSRGVAIVFVSHNLQQVASLCDRGIFLQHEVRAQGAVHDALAAYVNGTDALHDTGAGTTIEITGADLTDVNGEPVTTVEPGTPLQLTVDYEVHEELSDFHLGFVIYRSTDNMVVYDGGIGCEEAGLETVHPGQHLRLRFDFNTHLTRGQYHIQVHVYHNPSHTHLCKYSPAASLGVAESRSYAGVADVELSCVQARPALPHARPVRPASGW